jgi:hypothetical protein
VTIYLGAPLDINTIGRGRGVSAEFKKNELLVKPWVDPDLVTSYVKSQ